MERTASRSYLIWCNYFLAHMLINLSSQMLNEIMPILYKRFTDKSAEEWRQIYKVRIYPEIWG